jgi:hypothetical protein
MRRPPPAAQGDDMTRLNTRNALLVPAGAVLAAAAAALLTWYLLHGAGGIDLAVRLKLRSVCRPGR